MPGFCYNAGKVNASESAERRKEFTMSITIKDCLSLPSMGLGRVVAGKAGLDKIVSSVSVLEFVEHEGRNLYIFTPNELTLSAFYELRNDVDRQCEAICDLANTGSVGLVLFYVGKVVHRVDKKLIQIADKLDFPLIVLENDSYRIKYSDIISDVMEAIIQDQHYAKDFVSSTEKRLFQVPIELRTMENLLHIMSDHYKCSLLLSSSQTCFFVPYPPSLTPKDPNYYYHQFHATPTGYYKREVVCGDLRLLLYKMDFSGAEQTRMTLYAACQNTRLNERIMSDMCTCIGFFSSVWGYSLKLTSPQSLLSLIFKAEESAAASYLRNACISFDRICNLIIISPGNRSPKPLQQEICRCFDEYHKFYLADVIDGRLVILSSFALAESFDSALFADLLHFAEHYDEKASFFIDSGSKDIASLKSTYRDYFKNEHALQKIFLNRRRWDNHDIMLSREVISLSETNSKRTQYLSDIIAALKQDQEDLLNTLAIYMIDCDSKLNAAAKMLYLHRNTVTYRLNKARQLTNTNFTLMPAAYDFYTALALWRIQEEDPDPEPA